MSQSSNNRITVIQHSLSGNGEIPLGDRCVLLSRKPVSVSVSIVLRIQFWKRYQSTSKSEEELDEKHKVRQSVNCIHYTLVEKYQ